MFRDAVYGDREIFLEMAGEFYSSGAVLKPVNPENFVATFNAAMEKSPFMRLIIIEVDGGIIGYILLSFTFSNEAGGTVVWIEEIYIDKAHRRKGIGSGIFSYLEREYPDAKRFRLEVEPGNEGAMRLYGKLGYEVLGYIQLVKDSGWR